VGPAPLSPADAKKLRAQATVGLDTLAHPVPAGWWDPVSIALVLDCLLRLEHDTVIRARHLVQLMNAEYPQMSWNPTVVGRIMSDLAEASLASGATAEPPIDRFRASHGHQFIVNVNSLNWRWLIGVRRAVADYAETVIREERALGEFSPRRNFPFDVISQVRWGEVDGTVAA